MPAKDDTLWRLVETLGAGRWVAEPGMARLLTVSPSLEQRLGYRAEECERESGWWAARVHADDRARVEALRATLADHLVEYRFRAADGRYLWLREAVTVERDAAGAPAALVGLVADVSGERAERDRATSELRFQKAMLEAQIEASIDALLVIDPAGRAIVANGRFEELFGFPVDTARGAEGDRILRHVVESVVDPTAFSGGVDRLRGNADSIVRDEVRLKNGRVVERYGASVRGEGGMAYGWLWSFRDITARKLAEEDVRRRADELARLTVALARSNSELDQFAYIASHDLKAPLRGISNLSRWIEEDLGERVTPAAREHLDLLRGRTSRMEALIDALLEYSRVGRTKARAERVEVAALVDDVVDLLAPPAGFEVVAEAPMPAIVTERMRLQQVLLNLIGNAIKHHPDKAHGRVRVRVADVGDMWEFSVEDNGQGIDPRYHERVFVIFQTLAARDKVEGTGIGLALVKKIVEGFGGKVTLESEAGKGATFRFTWPKGVSTG